MYKVGDCDCGCGGKTIDAILPKSPANIIASMLSELIDGIYNVLDTAKDIPAYIYIPPIPPTSHTPGTPAIYIDATAAINGMWIVAGYAKLIIDILDNAEEGNSVRISGKEEIINGLVNTAMGQLVVDNNGNVHIRPDIGELPHIQDMLDEINKLPSQSEVCNCKPCNPDDPPQNIEPPQHYLPQNFNFWESVVRYMSSTEYGGKMPVFPPPGDLPNPQPVFPWSPIILDLNNDGVKTKRIEDGVYFDHNGNRFAEKSGWVDVNDALLVVDKNQSENSSGAPPSNCFFHSWVCVAFTSYREDNSATLRCPATASNATFTLNAAE